MRNVVRLAKEILEMQEVIEEQAYELARLRDIEAQYHELLGSSLAHSKHMVGQLLQLTMTPGVIEACRAAVEPA